MAAFQRAYAQQLAAQEAEKEQQRLAEEDAAHKRAMYQQRFNEYCVLALECFEKIRLEAAAADCYAKHSARSFETRAEASLEVEIPGDPKRVVKIVASLSADRMVLISASFKGKKGEEDKQYHVGVLGDFSGSNASERFDAALEICLAKAYTAK